MTGIEPALSAWELACQADADQGFAGQPPSPVVREYPLTTVSDLSDGHATGTAALSRNHLIRRDPQAHPLQAHTSADLPKCCSTMRNDGQRYAALCGQNPASTAPWPGRPGTPITVKLRLTLGRRVWW